MPTGTPDSILLFDETVEYLDMTKEEQKSYFNKKMDSLNKEQIKERVQLKIKRHKDRMSGGLKPETQDPKTTHRNKRNNQWNLDNDKNDKNDKKEKQAVLEKKDKMKKSLSSDDNKKLNGKKVKYYSGAEKKKSEPPKPKHKFQEDGQTIRGSTKRNIENKDILSYVEDEEDDINKNAKIQLEIKESNKKLKESMKKVTKYSVIKGYSTIKKKDNNIDDIERIGKIKFDRNILFDRQQKLNPSLLNNVEKFNILKKTDKTEIEKLNNTTVISAPDALRVLKWHEQRLNDYVDVINKQQDFINKLTQDYRLLTENYVNIQFNSKYNDLNTIKLHNNKIRKIQSTWRNYMIRKSVSSIKIQRWFRYVKNVKNVSDEVQEFINSIAEVQKQTTDISNFLNSLNSKKALPLERLKEIKQKLIKQQEVLDM
jgi:hypothetical protein